MISGRLSEDDFLAAQRLHRRRCSRGVTTVLLVVALVGIPLLFTDGLATGVTLMIVAICGLLGEALQSRLLLPWQARRLYRQCAAYRQSFGYSWDEESLSVTSESGHARRRWSDYVKFREDERIFLLYHADNLFEMLPKAWFAGTPQIEAVRRLAAKAGSPSRVAAPAS